MMEKAGKENQITLRIEKARKELWKKISEKKQISLTSLIIDSVENRIFEDERKKVLLFIDKQDNIFIRIENNINQVAKIVNAQKFISEDSLENFSMQLEEIKDLKQQQNAIFIKIYSLISNDY